MVVRGQSWTDSIHGLSGLRVWVLLALLHTILLSPSSLILQCDCGNESANCKTAQKLSPLLPEMPFCPPPRPSPPSSSPPQIHFLSPSLGQSQEPLTSYCGMLIEKRVAIRCVSNTKISLLDRKKGWANNFHAICNSHRMRKTWVTGKEIAAFLLWTRLLIMCLEFPFKRK